MTDKERDAAAATGGEGVADDETADGDALEGDDADDQADVDEDEDEDEDEQPAPALARSAPATHPTPGRGRGPARSAPSTPSISEQAVRVDDRVSAIFVIAAVGVFGLIFAYALLFGQNGFVTNLLPTPTPIVTPAPTASPVPGASAAPSDSAAPSGSAAPSSSASAAPSASPSPSAS